MAVLTAPLLSFGASGQIAKTQVYATWKGVPYARRHVIPANPQSTDQTMTRSVFAWLNDVWKIAPADFQTSWDAFVKGQPLTNRNAFISKNLPQLRPGTDLTGMVLSPGAKGGLAVTPTITPGTAQLTIAATAPSPLPSGWTVTRFIAAAIKQQDPHSDMDFEIFTGVDSTAAYSIVLSLTATTAYIAGGWFEYQRSALATDLAYGPNTGVLATTT
jgi:hypothetical protein